MKFKNALEAETLKRFYFISDVVPC